MINRAIKRYNEGASKAELLRKKKNHYLKIDLKPDHVLL